MKKLAFIFLILTSLGYAQVENDTIKLEPIEDTKALFSDGDSIVLKRLDSLITLKINKEAALIDSLWLNELIKSPLYDTIQYVLRDDERMVTELEELPTDLLKERLKVLNSKTPFHIEYNSSLESIIKTYLKRRKSSFSGLMEKARYYFPMFEEQLDKYDIPLEMKYLAIVESALKPRAKSRVGATGLWQFMYPTGKMFDLKVSSYVDERQDPYRATEAACKYLASLYKIFGDWDLALAAYNSGPGNVNKAIRRSNGSKNYWNIRHNLPRETAGYVPAFYATLYIFEYAKEHNIVAKKSALPFFKTDTVQVKRQMTFEQIHETLGVDIELLQFLNPQYKLDIIPYIKGRNYTLSLPVESIGNFVTNEKEIYAFVEKEEAKREKPLPKYTELNDRIRYKVKSGDFLGKIANRYGVSVSSLKRWNNMRSSRLKIGQRLTVYPRRLDKLTSNVKKTSTKKEENRIKPPLPTGPHQLYTVKNGDSLWVIAQKFPNVSVQNIKDWNDNWGVKNLKPGTKLKIFSK
ncbi:membrane-bound lytic murein transglycosylase D [Lutibacter oricola]|uniref:Membrane-bound lytic murein transglycosylase D n=1 Tax=Lutibacter oricola TaxID=762486 RepID=A0A1H2R284_9FLAO|nr:lytic transglycosylase domain-containing protein [Lutibacter oricola]SDW13298.1 membrane-bound lytic murein transglycosylase D [Lutibacter oricola]